jgi:hypothetical protein
MAQAARVLYPQYKYPPTLLTEVLFTEGVVARLRKELAHLSPERIHEILLYNAEMHRFARLPTVREVEEYAERILGSMISENARSTGPFIPPSIRDALKHSKPIPMRRPVRSPKRMHEASGPATHRNRHRHPFLNLEGLNAHLEEGRED